MDFEGLALLWMCYDVKNNHPAVYILIIIHPLLSLQELTKDATVLVSTTLNAGILNQLSYKKKHC